MVVEELQESHKQKPDEAMRLAAWAHGSLFDQNLPSPWQKKKSNYLAEQKRNCGVSAKNSVRKNLLPSRKRRGTLKTACSRKAKRRVVSGRENERFKLSRPIWQNATPSVNHCNQNA